MPTLVLASERAAQRHPGALHPLHFSRALKDTPASPLLYLSSSEAGWEGLAAQAFHEPMELEGWMTTAMPDISLILFAGGAMRMEQRHANGPWRDRKSTRLNSSHQIISYAVFCLKKKKKE